MKNKHEIVKTNRQNRTENAVAKRHLKGHSSPESVGKYSAIWLRRSNPRVYSECYLQMLTIKVKGFSPPYILLVLAQQSQHLQTWALYSFSPVIRVVLNVLLTNPKPSLVLCANAVAIAQPRQGEGQGWKGYQWANWTHTVAFYC